MWRRVALIASLGAVAGTMIALVATALSAGLVMDGALDFVTVDAATSGGRGIFVVADGSLYLYVLASATFGGALVAFLTAVVSGIVDPAEPRFRPGPVTIAGAVLAAVVAYGVLRAGIGVGGIITAGVVTLSVFRAIIVFLLTGAGAGATAAVAAERLSRPVVLGLEGEAWPESRSAFARESMPAMVVPVLAVVLIGAVVFGLSRALLAGTNATAVILAGGVAIIVLALGALIAAHPPPSGDGGEAQSETSNATSREPSSS